MWDINKAQQSDFDIAFAIDTQSQAVIGSWTGAGRARNALISPLCQLGGDGGVPGIPTIVQHAGVTAVRARQFQRKHLLKQASGGPDGDSVREYTTGELSECSDGQRAAALPSYFPIPAKVASPAAEHQRIAPGMRLSSDQRQAISMRAAHKSLRSLADEFSVSHETIRRIARQVRLGKTLI
jgi:hypothetical protein